MQKKTSSVLTSLFLIICVQSFTGCLSGDHSNKSWQSKGKRTLQSYNSAREAILREPEVTIDIIWVLKEYLKVADDPEMQKFVDQQTEFAKAKGHHSLRLIDPTAPYNMLTQDQLKGIALYKTYLKAPFGQPKDRAISLLSEFLVNNESGYVQTHQFLAIEWAQQTGLELPPTLKNRKSDLLEKIYAEQLKDNSFFDLYAERVALLLRFYEPKPKQSDVEDWIDEIIKDQLEDGNWKVASTPISYDGQFALVTPASYHTTALSMLALHIYLNEY